MTWALGWAGHLGDLLHEFDSDSAALLTADAATAHPDPHDYKQQKLRNYLRDGEVYKALLAPARYGRRLLAAMHAEVAAGRHAFCETRGPSLCKQQQQRSWCRTTGMRQARPDLFADGASSRPFALPHSLYGCCSGVTADDLRTLQAQWDNRSAWSKRTRRPMTPRGLFVHRMND